MMAQEHTQERSIDERDREVKSANDNICPECQGHITRTSDSGEATCESCGLVFEDNPIDHGPEWRAFTSEERDEKSRVGAPTTQLMHDKGLSTTIGWQDKDAYGQAVSGRKRAQLQRLRTWDERFRTKDAHERNLKQALGEISRMASALGLPESVRETAGVLYRRAVEQNLLPGRSIEGMSTASLYAAARQHGMPRPLTEFADVSRVEKIRIQRAYRYLSRELGLEIEPEDPMQYIPQFASSLDVSDEAERRSRELLEVATDNAVHSGKSPAGLAAAALYAATHLTNEQLTQETVSEVAHVSRVTIRNRYQELLEVYAQYD
ncbi:MULTISPECIES: transcription initiation factor IIB [Halobacteriales]|jgi:transcription initiation factor TFIIB|uniref:Transcription initiation factor IIB n=4 Tax=Halobacteriales TaxID=2235 RepID=Q5V735_HALMA|nr:MULTISPECIES: TFIIB-type zinc ribbon-containing protein [Halobacteria]AAV44623.1 transcription initiation factor IIB [Haloarcula marismortui ATCC 43049]EMA27580.1 transcription initiation factor IIB [Haloarcula japonica DSM 6131]KAB7513585.1 transcription initiation factor IIB 2 [Halosegnis rubeus]QCP89499.1 transcription initiation factor IIB 2 [Haloarcula marismortui ATCC 43049]QZY04865.1 transcription initiation factor IIB 2 [Halobaculum roseum]